MLLTIVTQRGKAQHTLMGLNFLEMLNIKKPMVPRGGLSPAAINYSKNNDLERPHISSVYH